MTKKPIIFLLFITIAYCCTNKSKENNITTDVIDQSTSEVSIEKLRSGHVWGFDSLMIDKRIYVNNDTSKQGMLVSLSIKYPISAPENANLEETQQSIANIILDRKSSNTPSLQSVFNDKLNDLKEEALSYGREWKSENNEHISFSDYQLTYNFWIENISKNVICGASMNYYYLGGAHGLHHLRYYNIATDTGEIVSEKYLFINDYKTKVAALLQEDIKKRNSSENEDEHIYLLIEISEIKPNDNFCINKDGLTYIYNQYEIAPYSQGVVEITIPYEKIKPYIKKEYLYLFE